ncbi:hypothetical protein D3C80_2042030 [compost metagenome]
MGTVASVQHTLHVGLVLGDQLRLEFGFALVGLHLLETRAVLGQLGKLMLVGGCAFH